MDMMATLVEHGMLLESAKGPIPNVATLVAGEPIRGSWWGHPKGHEIYGVINDLGDSPDVVRLRLVNGKITVVHRRVWPALVQLVEHFKPAQLAALREEHTPSGAHRVIDVAFPDWVPQDVAQSATGLTDDEAWSMLPECLRPRRN